jgi:hypothetical protein
MFKLISAALYFVFVDTGICDYSHYFIVFYYVLHSSTHLNITLLQTTENIEVPGHSAALYANRVWRWERFLPFRHYFSLLHAAFSKRLFGPPLHCMQIGFVVDYRTLKLKGRVTHQAIYLFRPLLCHLSMTSSESYSYSLANSSAVALWEILVLRGSRADCNVELQTRALVQSDVHAKRWTRWNTPECTCFLLGGAEWCRREAMNASEHS